MKEKLPTLILRLDFGDREFTRLNHLITEAEDFIAQMKKEFGHLGEEVVHQCIFSSEQEVEAFRRDKRWLRGIIFQRNRAIYLNKAGKEGNIFPEELEILVRKDFLPKSIHFFSTNSFSDKEPSVDETQVNSQNFRRSMN